MDTFTKRDLQRLLAEQEGPFVSLYLKTYRAGEAGQQGPIRLKNLVRSAEDQLVARGGRAPDVQVFLEPVWELLGNKPFWNDQADGLAVFRAANLFAPYRLDLAFADAAVVGSRFLIRPLLPLLTRDGQYWILAVSQKSARLLEATRDSVTERAVAGMPEGLAEALGYTEMAERFHDSGRQTHGGPQPNVYRGKVALVDLQQSDLLKYFQAIDRAIHPCLRESHAPLVASMVERYFPVFAEACSYPHLLQRPLAGNPEPLSAEELRARAWPMVAPVFQQESHAAIERYWKLAHQEKATDDIQAVVQAAHEGRVEALLVQAEAALRGDIDRRTGRPVLHPDLTTGSEDLIDLAAAATLRKSGAVYALPADQVPGGKGMAAILRYPSPGGSAVT